MVESEEHIPASLTDQKHVRIPRVLLGMLVVIVLAGVMTAISLSIYTTSGAVNIDLSRPGYEDSRKNLIVNTTDSEQFDNNGTLDKQAFEVFFRLYNKRIAELKNTGDFGDSSLGDPNIGLIPDTTNTPSDQQ